MTARDPKAPEGAQRDRSMAKDAERRLLAGPSSRLAELLRVLRIAWEFVGGFRRLHFVGPCVTVFGSARFREGHPYYALAQEIGGKLAEVGFTVMTGGGPGLMEAANRGAKEAGGRSVGCNIVLPQEQAPNAYLDEWITFNHFYVRKVMLVKYSYAFVVMPGGFGTMDEVYEVATLVQTGKLQHFPVVLVCSDYWQPLFDFMQKTQVASGTIEQHDLDHLSLVDSADAAIEIIRDAALNTFGLKYAEPRPRKRWFLFE